MKNSLFFFSFLLMFLFMPLVSSAPYVMNDSFTIYPPTFGLEEGSFLANDDPGLALEYLDFSGINITSPFKGNLTGFDGYLGLFNYTGFNFTGVDYFKYLLTNVSSNSTEAYVVIKASNNSAPSFNFDMLNYNGSIFFIDSNNGLLSNVSNDEGDRLFINLVKSVSFGNLTLFDDGSFNYTSNKTQGVDYFKYKVTDLDKSSSEILVLIHLENNTAPVAYSDNYFIANRSNTGEDIVLSQNVLTNDSDADSDFLYAYLNDTVKNGTLYFNVDGSFDYLPNANFTGVDSFSYYVSDRNLSSAVVLVRLYVNTSIPIESVSSSSSSSSGSSGSSGSGGQAGCTTKWVCSAWENCINGSQSRNCSKILSNCYAGLMPNLTQSCESANISINESIINKTFLENFRDNFSRMTGAVTSSFVGAWGSLKDNSIIVFSIIGVIFIAWIYMVFLRKIIFSKQKKSKKSKK